MTNIQEDILQMDIEQLWQNMPAIDDIISELIYKKMYEYETDENGKLISKEKYIQNLKNDYQRIRSGYKILCDIRLYIRYLNGKIAKIKEHLKSQEVYWDGKFYRLEEWDDEWDMRIKKMRKILMDYYEPKQGPVKSRI